MRNRGIHVTAYCTHSSASCTHSSASCIHYLLPDRYYSPKILEESGFESTGEQLGITMVLAARGCCVCEWCVQVMGIIKTGVIMAAAALLDGVSTGS